MEQPTDPSYSLLSSLRYDDALLNMDWNTRANGGKPSPFMLLPYHLDRLMAAAQEHGWHLPVWTLDDLQNECAAAVRVGHHQHPVGPQKVRPEVSHRFQRR